MLNEIENRIIQLRRELEAAEADLERLRGANRRQEVFNSVYANIRDGKLINAIQDLRALPDNGPMNLLDAKQIVEFINTRFIPRR